MSPHPDLTQEQAHIDRAYARIEEMRQRLIERRDEVIASGEGGTHQFREERDVIVRSSLLRLEQLNVGDEALCFGRIDQIAGDRFYIGRLAIADADQEPLIVDWRAPIAEPFYRATGRHPMGLTRRRHFIAEGRTIIGIEDEILDLDHLPENTALAGEGALLVALERSRTGTMRDIVATIQGEQDEIIRAPMAGVLVVQGGPGTGKTAVALHRAAYLLYTHRFPLERQGVLVVGPNPLFLRYIQHVLPSLGETGVHLSTVAGLYPGAARTRRPEAADVARVKGDVRMAKVIARAVHDRQRPLRRDAAIPFGAYTLRLTAAASAEVVNQAKRRPGTHNARRSYVETLVVRRLHEQYENLLGRAARVGLRVPRAGDGDDPQTRNQRPDDDEGVNLEEFTEDVLAVRELTDGLDRMWPILTPEELLHDLFGAPALVDLAARKHLSDHERALLVRPRSASFDEIPWTIADVPLLDETLVHLGPRRRRAGDPDVIRSFGHVVVDEAQDLTPMQLRMLSRRSLGGSMTVVGDIGQATGPFSPSSWSDVLVHLPSRKPSRLVELSVNYRTPSEIMDVAARVLAAAAPELVPPSSVRSTGVQPTIHRVDDPSQVAARALAEAATLSEEVQGTVAVICPPSLSGDLGAALEDDINLDAPVSIIEVGSVKGLEFDAVIVVEPGLIANESRQGLKALYVSLTRATKRLTMVASRPLPAVLGL
ncbi:MAG TPA: ATP-binding domain-containing protein [Acidimicrobiales bacterium]|jgi:DNA helicase IV|nr:ATP-binding domain-containing protein [Acidimicrobiales bacterium]